MIRRPVAAGTFYPADGPTLVSTVDALLAAAGRRAVPGLQALVAPHAGYAYSGPVAASAFSLAPRAARVVLLGPSHFFDLAGMAVSSADAWETPLGAVPLSSELRAAALDAGALADDVPHAGDHALEVELPFLQRSCPDGLEILPVAVGRTEPSAVARLLQALAALAVVSTDLSHYLDRATATRVDHATAEAVVRRDPDALGERSACGIHALRGLLEHARRRHLDVELLDVRTSADAVGDSSRVVGYGAFAFTSGEAELQASAIRPGSRSRACRRRGSR